MSGAAYNPPYNPSDAPTGDESYSEDFDRLLAEVVGPDDPEDDGSIEIDATEGDESPSGEQRHSAPSEDEEGSTDAGTPAEERQDDGGMPQAGEDERWLRSRGYPQEYLSTLSDVDVVRLADDMRFRETEIHGRMQQPSGREASRSDSEVTREDSVPPVDFRKELRPFFDLQGIDPESDAATAFIEFTRKVARQEVAPVRQDVDAVKGQSAQQIVDGQFRRLGNRIPSTTGARNAIKSEAFRLVEEGSVRSADEAFDRAVESIYGGAAPNSKNGRQRQELDRLKRAGRTSQPRTRVREKKVDPSKLSWDQKFDLKAAHIMNGGSPEEAVRLYGK